MKILNKKAFTLVELIITISVMAILAVGIFVATKPQKRIGETNDAKRKNDAQVIEQSIKVMAADGGVMPSELKNLTENTAFAIVKAGGVVTGLYSCTALGISIDKKDISSSLLSVLTAMPLDPDLSSNSNETGYYIVRRGSSYDVESCNTYRLAATTGSRQMCGDGYCGSTESCSSCAQDCGACPPQVIFSGVRDSEVYSLNSVYVDANYIYGAGYHFAVNGIGYRANLVKLNKSDFSLVGEKILGGPANQYVYSYFEKVLADSNYIYTIGRENNYGGTINKFNQSDLSVVYKKNYGSTSATALMDAVQDENYIYAVGSQAIGGLISDGLLLKIAKSDMSISIKKTHGDGVTYSQAYNGVYSDGTYLYAVGNTYSASAGYQALITKFNLSDFSVVASKTYGGTANKHESFESVYADGSNIYAVGYADSDTYYDHGLVVKFNTDLTVDTAKEIYINSVGQLIDFYTLQSVGSDLYLLGTRSGRYDAYTGLAVKVAKSDLVISASKNLTGNNFAIFRGSYLYGSDLYVSGENGMAISKFSSLPTGSFSTTPSYSIWNDISLTSVASDSTLADTSYTLSDSSTTYTDSPNSLTEPTIDVFTTYSISN